MSKGRKYLGRPEKKLINKRAYELSQLAYERFKSAMTNEADKRLTDNKPFDIDEIEKCTQKLTIL